MAPVFGIFIMKFRNVTWTQRDVNRGQAPFTGCCYREREPVPCVHEVVHVVDWLTFEAVLEEMPYALIFLVEIIDVAWGKGLDDFTDSPCSLLYRQMEVIAHQAVGVYGACRRRERRALWTVLQMKVGEYVEHVPVVLLTLEYLLAVDASHHDMIDSCAWLYASLPWHCVSTLTVYPQMWDRCYTGYLFGICLASVDFLSKLYAKYTKLNSPWR